MKLLTALLILTLGSWSAPPAETPAPSDPPATFQFHEDSEMTVLGTSNVHDWTMDVETLDGQLVVQPAADGGAPTVERLQVQVPVERIVSDKDRQNRKTYDALQSNAYPTIFFRSDEVDVTAANGEDGTFEIVARGELIIAGARRTVDVQATGTRLDDGTYRFEGEHDLLLSDFEVDRPSAMLGTIRVGDDVTLAFDVIVTPE